MNAREAASSAVYYLSRLTPRGPQEEQELLHVIQALKSFSNARTNGYNEKSVINAT
jgi:hypothetical protein